MNEIRSLIRKNVKRPIYIWGASKTGRYLKEFYKGLNFVGFIDKNPLLWGTSCLDLPVFSPAILDSIEIIPADDDNTPFFLLATMDNHAIKNNIEKKGFKRIQDYDDESGVPFFYNIEVFGKCNLKCPSCPVGNSIGTSRPNEKYMSIQLFKDIIKKIKRETPVISAVGLYNWSEPLLHPHIDELIKVLKENDIYSKISSNFNFINFERLTNVIEIVDELRISVSGFSQEHYGLTHQTGNIERVKQNMRKLKEIIDGQNSSVRIEVLYHMYMHNTGEELQNMKRFSESLSFDFVPVFAYLMPLEKNMKYYRQEDLSESDKKIIDMLIHSPNDCREISRKYNSQNCTLRSEQTTINVDGSVALCCGVYDSKYTITHNFLDVTLDELQSLKNKHSFCKECMSFSLHDTAIYRGISELNARGRELLGNLFVEQQQ